MLPNEKRTIQIFYFLRGSRDAVLSGRRPILFKGVEINLLAFLLLLPGRWTVVLAGEAERGNQLGAEPLRRVRPDGQRWAVQVPADFDSALHGLGAGSRHEHRCPQPEGLVYEPLERGDHRSQVAVGQRFVRYRVQVDEETELVASLLSQIQRVLGAPVAPGVQLRGVQTHELIVSGRVDRHKAQRLATHGKLYVRPRPRLVQVIAVVLLVIKQSI